MEPAKVKTNYHWECPGCGAEVLVSDIGVLDQLDRRKGPVEATCPECGHETEIEFPV